jgi:hypothetical protein
MDLAVQDVASVQKVELEHEDISQEVPFELADKSAGSTGRATCEPVVRSRLRIET